MSYEGIEISYVISCDICWGHSINVPADEGWLDASRQTENQWRADEWLHEHRIGWEVKNGKHYCPKCATEHAS